MLIRGVWNSPEVCEMSLLYTDAGSLRMSRKEVSRSLRGSATIVRDLLVWICYCAVVAGLSGCAKPGMVTGGDPNGDQRFNQSETAITTTRSNGQDIIVVAYNDGTNTGSTVLYTSDNRTVLNGASLMGWSYSLDKGQTWRYGGKVLPPQDWAALWGDPSITTSGTESNVVFMSNLAIPASKMPPNGISGRVNDFIGGACIARSTDGGQTFQPYAMVSNNQDPYDGGCMAAAQTGEIYAAYIDMAADRIDIWRAPNDNGQFALMPNPFPDMTMYSHARIRTSPYDGTVYVAAQADDYAVYMTRWTGQAWLKPIRVSDGPVELYPVSTFVTGTIVRTGPQFSFDIGAASTGDGRDAIRVLYTMHDPETKRMFVTGSYVNLDLTDARTAPEWGTTPGNLNTPGDQFNPNVRAWQGFFGLPPVWKATYMNRDPNALDKLDLMQGNLAYLPDGTRIYVPFNAMQQIPACPDLRGYWGDYDGLEIIGFESSGAAQFLRTVSDSSLGCQMRWEYTSHHVHISAAIFN